MKLFYQISTNPKQSIIIIENCSISDLKSSISSHSGLDINILRLVFKGKILIDYHTLDNYGISENDSIHVAKLSNNTASLDAATKSSSSTSAPPNSMDSDDMFKILENPMMSSFMNNPDFMSAMLESDPRITQMAQKNPEIRTLMRDPQFLRQTMNMLKNPSARKEMMRNQDRQLSNIEAIPGGFNYLSSMFKDMDPLNESGSDPSTEEANKKLAEKFGVSPTSPTGINTQPLPNPWAPVPKRQTPSSSANVNPFPFSPFGMNSNSTTGMSDFSSLMQQMHQFQPAMPSSNMNQNQGLERMLEQIQQLSSINPNSSHENHGFPGQSFPMMNSTSVSVDPPEVRFSSQISALSDMGFTDKEKCTRALLAGGGNVEAAIAYLLDNQ